MASYSQYKNLIIIADINGRLSNAINYTAGYEDNRLTKIPKLQPQEKKRDVKKDKKPYMSFKKGLQEEG
ncbi:MAG: hypothetical protein HY754_12595 [Nitrospirae bacterium]|nr:hypothetical protein [Nitrospirota bacterium]